MSSKKRAPARKKADWEEHSPLGDVRVDIKYMNSAQKDLARLIQNNELIICSGAPGTGKTLVSCAEALQLVKNDPRFRRIVLVKSVTVLRDEELGYMKGTLREKMEPIVYSFISNMERLIGKANVARLMEQGVIDVMPIAFMRGANLDDCVVLVDECLPSSAMVSTSMPRSDDRIGKKSRVTKQLSIETIGKMFEAGKRVEVLSMREDGTVEMKPVTHFFRNGVKPLFKVKTANRGTLTGTANHPVGVWKDGSIHYVEIGGLKAGDRLIKLCQLETHNAKIITDGLDIVAGWILGDGHLSRTPAGQKTYRLAKNHGMSQADYAEWCMGVIKGTRRKVKSGYTGKPLFGFQSKSLVFPDRFVGSFLADGKKCVSNGAKEYITERTLAIWLMDDGFFDRSTGSVTFCTHSFSSEETQLLSDVLRDKFGIENSVHVQNGRNGVMELYHLIRLSKAGSARLFELTAGLVHPNLGYKTLSESRFDPGAYSIGFMDGFTVDEVVTVEQEGEEEVFNIEVADNNNYFVGKKLVHNCQNISMQNMRTIMTRMGHSCKMIFTGDTQQTDIRRPSQSALPQIIEMFEAEPIVGVGVMHIGEEHIVRNPLVREVERLFGRRA